MESLSNFAPSTLLLVGLLVVGIAMLWAAMRRRTQTDAPSDRLSTPARVFLVLLRLVIGWHLLIEGLEKLHSPSWSSEGYLREAVGPLAPRFRALAGDGVIDQLSLGDPLAEQKSLPPALVKEWDRYLSAFTSYYRLDETQSKKAAEEYAKAKSATLVWMVTPRPIVKLSPTPPELYVEWNVPERLKEYDRFQKELADIERDMPRRGEKSWKEWRDAKSNVAKWRGELKKDLDSQTAAFKKALESTLSADQKLKPALAMPPRPFDWSRQLDIADAIVKYGLVVFGICLIAGCFTRTAALGGAVLLFMFYLAMPSLPYLPESPKSEGHYVYINKNIIEMIALLALASLQTGRWAGLDGLLQFLNPFNWPKKKKKAAEGSAEKQPTTTTTTIPKTV